MAKKSKESYTRTYAELLETRERLQLAQADYAELQCHLVGCVTDAYENLKAQVQVLAPELDLTLFSLDNTVEDGKIMPAPDDEDEEPNIDSKKFYEMLDAANQPLYSGCREGLSKLSLAARMMNIKTDHNLPKSCMNEWADLFKEYLPEDNVSADSYYEIQKLVYSLGLPSEMIDVCIDNCMIYWGDDEKLEECRFCKKP